MLKNLKMQPVCSCVFVLTLAATSLTMPTGILAEPSKSATSQPSTQSAEQPFEPLFSISVDGKKGYIDKTGKVVIEPRFGMVQRLFDGRLAMACRPDRLSMGYIDRKGDWAIEPRYGDAHSFKEGLAAVRIDGEFGFIDETGRVVITPQYDCVGWFYQGVARVGVESWSSLIKRQVADVGTTCNWVYIDKKGRRISKARAEKQREQAEQWELKPKEKDGRYGLIDRDGNWTLPPTLVHIRAFHGGRAAARSNNGWGHIDETGKLVIAVQYEFVEDYVADSNVSVVKQGGKWGMINDSGDWIVKPRFSWSNGIQHGLWSVVLDGKAGYIDLSGNWVWEPTN